jgi:glycine cleavage system H protein
MTIFLFIAMVAIVLAAEWWFHRGRALAEKKDQGEQLSMEDIDGVKLSQQLAYHPFHMWVRKLDSQTAQVGLDDFARRLVGTARQVTLPQEGQKVSAGQSCSKITNGTNVAFVVSPVAGEVVETNQAVFENPELIFDDPYGDGWLFKVRSWSLTDQIKCLLTGSRISEWMRNTIDRLKFGTTVEATAVAQDGGQLCEDLTQHLDRYEWIKVIRENLGTEPMIQGENVQD